MVTVRTGQPARRGRSRLELRLHLKYRSGGRQFWTVAAEREDAGRFIVHAHDIPTAFLEVESAIRSATKIALRNRA
jgi:hypothetical protein